ncbi:MAG: 16S rRNA (guanine(527)-N(7))-methyltransferase RsmG [Limnobacter sp.]|nr:16S rRNA (guanine(527)-N(7))-methyltransferase RsmG [Limnobacter sp.]
MTHPQQQALEEGLAQLGLALSVRQIEQLLAYGDLIAKWNRVYNLTAIRHGDEILTHHLLDCLAALPALEAGIVPTSTHEHSAQTQVQPLPVRVLDVGAGAGLPGLIWAIAKPHWQITCLDTVQKKVVFMQQAIGSLQLCNARAVHARIEAWQPGQVFDVITSRAFSSMSQFIDLSQACLAPGGVFAAMKGRWETDQDVSAGWLVQAVCPLQVPFLTEARHLFLIRR